MIDAQQVEIAAAPVGGGDHNIAPSIQKPMGSLALSTRDCAPSENDEIIVCGRRDQEQFRMRPLPPRPESESLLSRPLRLQIAPGVSIGFQKKGGFGLRAELGPGKKTDEAAD